VARSLQHRQAAQRLRVSTTGTRKHRSKGPEANHALTIKPDHPMGAGHSDGASKPRSGAASCRRPRAELQKHGSANHRKSDRHKVTQPHDAPRSCGLQTCRIVTGGKGQLLPNSAPCNKLMPREGNFSSDGVILVTIMRSHSADSRLAFEAVIQSIK
jgi:hypothetical protein